MTPEDVKLIRDQAPDRGAKDMLSMTLALCSALETAWKERDEYEALFELQRRRSVEANELWRAEDPVNRRNVQCDLGKLLEWLMQKAER